VVEVASHRTRLYDRNRKKDVYEGFGIPAYWIVEPDPDRPVSPFGAPAAGDLRGWSRGWMLVGGPLYL